MNLLDIVRRTTPPDPWLEGDKLPWHDPAFSARMLREHLSQAHDRASRRSERVAAHVDWIHEQLLHARPSRVLDLACGPGLYTARLAALGHECTGVDVAPAAIEYARTTAEQAKLTCSYELADIRTAAYGGGFDLVMLVFGEFNTFRPSDARAILAKARGALVPGGLLLLEAHTEAAVRRLGATPPSWRAAEHGLFFERPHLRLDESAWDEVLRVATRRYFIVDATTAEVARYAESTQAYTDDEYRTLLEQCGFTGRGTPPGWDLSGEPDEFVVLVGAAR